jgi:hypothetical protein
MARKTVRPRRRKKRTAARRTFPWHKAPKRRTRRRSKVARRKSRSGKRIRPVVIVSGGKFYRPRRSKAFKRPTRINGRRRRRNPTRQLRRALSVANITRYLAIGGGMVAGSMVTSFFSTGVLPFGSTSIYPAGMQDMMQKARPFMGLANLVVGSMVASRVRNPMLKDAALGIAAYGGFDLFTQVLKLMGVSQLAGMDISGPFLGAGRFESQNRSYGMPAVVDGMDIPMVGEMEPDFADNF